MNNRLQSSKNIKTICWIFLITGFLELLICIIFSRIINTSTAASLLWAMPGLITIISAYKSKESEHRNYFSGIWSILKYNPITIPLVTFIINDLFSSGELPFQPFVTSFFILLGVVSFILGIAFIILNIKNKKNEGNKISHKPRQTEIIIERNIHTIQNNMLSSDEALNQLKIAKEKLDLQLISQDEYDNKKEELRSFIK